VEVLNVGGGMLTSTKHVGSGITSLQAILAAPDHETDLTIQLTHNKKQEKGLVKLHAKVIDDTPPPSEPAKTSAPAPESTPKKEEPAENNQDKEKSDPHHDNSITDNNTKVNDQEKHEQEQEQQEEEEKKVSTPASSRDASPPTAKPAAVRSGEDPDNRQDSFLPPLDFERALLCIHRVSVHHLKNVETLGKNVRQDETRHYHALLLRYDVM
jgi:hypothetical protein